MRISDWSSDVCSSDRYGAGVGKGRKLPENTADIYVRQFASGLTANGGDAAAYAKTSGLVTSVETLEQFRKRMGAQVGMDDDIGSFRQIHYLDYLSAVGDREQNKEEAAAKGTVALVFVQGEIVDGDGAIGQAGGDAIADLLDQARRDDDVSRSEEHTSELQSLMRISYAVFCLKKKK